MAELAIPTSNTITPTILNCLARRLSKKVGLPVLFAIMQRNHITARTVLLTQHYVIAFVDGCVSIAKDHSPQRLVLS